jgi:Flp pilus assembly protein TadB
MIFLSVVGGVIVVALALAGWYDHRVKRHGGRVRDASREADQRRLDVDVSGSPWAQGGAQSWKNWPGGDR